MFILDEVESVPVTPLFATQPIANEEENMASSSERGKTPLIFTYQPVGSWTENILGMYCMQSLSTSNVAQVRFQPGAICGLRLLLVLALP